MGEMKSAWEIAQARANRLGKLSVEEERRQGEERCSQIGTMIAQRFLGHYDPQNIQAELGKYSAEEKAIITRKILSELAQTIDLRSQDRVERLACGILCLKPEAEGTIQQIKELSQEYEQTERKTRQEIEAKAREVLHQMRISGSAIGNINIEAKQEWQQSLQQLAQPFQGKLDVLKQDLC